MIANAYYISNYIASVYVHNKGCSCTHCIHVCALPTHVGVCVYVHVQIHAYTVYFDVLHVHTTQLCTVCALLVCLRSCTIALIGTVDTSNETPICLCVIQYMAH